VSRFALRMTAPPKRQLSVASWTRELGILRGGGDQVAIVNATAGVLAGHPDWPEWLADVRGQASRL
jgi:hypothetical protein